MILLEWNFSWPNSIHGPWKQCRPWASGSNGTKEFPRPEEVVYLIAIREYTAADGVPQGLIDKIHSMKLCSAHNFNTYDFGSPTHPS